MAAAVKVEHNNFSAGEISPWLRNRTNLDRYQNGLKTCANFVLLPEGGITRRPGTRFVLALKTESEIGREMPFRYSGSDSYMVVLNGGVARFVRAGGFILSAGVPYELAIPWAAADLDNIRWAQEGNTAWLTCTGFQPRKLTRGTSHTDWTLALYQPTGGPVKIQNLDTTKTIIASATSGSGIALTGVGTAFAATDIGSVLRLDESDLSLTANWKAGEAISIPTEALPVSGTKIGDYTSPANAFDANIATFATGAGSTAKYLGVNEASPSAIFSVRVQGFAQVAGTGTVSVQFNLRAKTGAAPSSSSNGTSLAISTQNFTFAVAGSTVNFDFSVVASDTSTKWDYIWIETVPLTANTTLGIYEFTGTRFQSGGNPVLRRYNGNVYQAIAGTTTGVNAPTHTDGDVLSETGGTIWRYRHKGYGMVRITAVADATHSTADVVLTLPDSVTQRATYRWWPGAWNGADGWPDKVLLIDRGLFFGRGADWWMTTVANQNDFEVTTLADSAITQKLHSRQGTLPAIEWALDNGVIVLGCRDNEILIRAPGTYEALTSSNVRAPPGSREGSAPHVPAAVENGVIFIGRSRKRLHYAEFDPDTQKLTPSEVSITGRHLLKGKAAALAWQRDPLRVLWGANQDGTLFGLTFMTEHKIAGMHSHPLTNGIVEDIKSIPSSDEGVSDVYMIVRRTVNGATHRYIEQLGTYFDATDSTANGAWFFDSALSYSGAPVSNISGLNHLIGQSVGVLADYAAHARKVVDNSGAIALDRPASNVVVGLPIDARLVDLPRNVALQTGSTKGEKKRASHCIVDLVETIGGSVSVNGGHAEPLALTGGTRGQNYGAAPQLFTGAKRAQLVGPLADEAEISIIAAEGMPMTVTGLAPDLDVVED